jgi:DNA-binding HxlR family transcriptional regulator
MSVITLAELPGRPCPIAASLELVGERWALLVVREIHLGNTRFTDIVRGTGAPRDRIAARLKALEEADVIERRPYSDAPPRHEYHLTAAGRALVPVLDGLLAWGKEHAVAADDPDRDRHLSAVGGSAPPGPRSRPAGRPG